MVKTVTSGSGGQEPSGAEGEDKSNRLRVKNRNIGLRVKNRNIRLKVKIGTSG